MANSEVFVERKVSAWIENIKGKKFKIEDKMINGDPSRTPNLVVPPVEFLYVHTFACILGVACTPFNVCLNAFVGALCKLVKRRLWKNGWRRLVLR